MNQITAKALGAMDRYEKTFQNSVNNIVTMSTKIPHTEPATDKVSLSTEMVGMMVAEKGFQAATKVIKASDEMTQSVLDIMA